MLLPGANTGHVWTCADAHIRCCNGLTCTDQVHLLWGAGLQLTWRAEQGRHSLRRGRGCKLSLGAHWGRRLLVAQRLRPLQPAIRR
jgi:hypothetical protein